MSGLLCVLLAAAPPAAAPAKPAAAPAPPAAAKPAPSADQARMVDMFIARVPKQMTRATEASNTTVNSIPVVQRSVVSSAKPAELRTYFADTFKLYGLWTPPIGNTFTPEVGQQVTGLDTDNMISYTAWFQPSGSYTTVVIASANVAKPGPVKEVSAPIAPVFPGSFSITSYLMEAVQGMTYSSPGTPAEIKSFYREQFGKMGFHETEENSMVFMKGTQRAWVTIAPAVSVRQVAVYLQTNADPGTKVPGPVINVPSGSPTPAQPPGPTPPPK